MKKLIVVAGIMVSMMGLVWIGQGTGYFPYPARSFMINQTVWVYRGALLFVTGAALVWLGRRR